MNTSGTMAHRSRKQLFLLSSSLALIATVTFTPLAHAQFAPVGSRRMGFAMINDALYIQGGFDTDASNQFISLDLSTSWSTTSPSWTQLKDGQSTTHLALAPISAASNGGTKGSLLAIGGMSTPVFFSSFDINSGQWQNMTGVKAPYTYLEGHAAVSDPNTGLVYMIGGYGANNTYNQLSVYDPKAKSMASQSSATAATSLTDVAAVWASARNSVLTFGGTRAPPANTNGLGSGDLSEYVPSSKTWKTMSTKGDVPPARLDHCMAASEDGSKVVLFGGTEDGNMYFNTIYILDVSSGKWKQGQEAPVARTRMACAVHSYQFIAWGGSSGGNRNTMLNNLPIVYNLNDDKWTDNYNADEKLRHNNTGAIIGGLFAVLVIAGGVGVFVMKKRQRQKHEEEAAYQADAMAAAAISEDHDSNIKVLAQSPQMTYGNASGYEGYGNEYQMNKMDMNGHYQNGSYDGVGPVHGYHDGMSGAGIVGDPNLQYYHSPSMSAGGMEKSPGAYSHLSPAMLYTGVPNTPQMQSPAVLYAGVSHTPQIQSPAVVYLHQQPEGNPFMSPEDYHRPPPHLSAPSVSSSVTLSPSPFMTATMAMSAKATEYQAPSQSNPFQTPVQQYQSPVWTTATYQAYPSPSPGARAPQAIPETSNAQSSSEYVPPPSM